MYRQIFAVLALNLFLLVQLTNGISLSNFNPQATGLTPACAAVYSQQIASCTDADFGQGSLCSSACINALVVIQSEIFKKCATDSKDHQNLIGSFLDGNGIPSICRTSSNASNSSGASSVAPQQTPQVSSAGTAPSSVITSATTPNSDGRTTLHTTILRTIQITSQLTRQITVPSLLPSTPLIPSSLLLSSPVPTSAAAAPTTTIWVPQEASTTGPSATAASVCHKGNGNPGTLIEDTCNAGSGSLANLKSAIGHCATFAALGLAGWVALLL